MGREVGNVEAIAQADGPPRRPRVAELGSVWIGIVAAMGLTILWVANTDPYERAILPGFMFFAIAATPGLLALLATHRRPGLYLASGLIYIPASFLSFSGLTSPLLFVSAMAFVAYGRHADEERPMVWAPLTAMICFLSAIGAFVVTFLGDDPACSPDGSSCTSNIITNADAVAGLALVVMTLRVGWLLSKPRDD